MQQLTYTPIAANDYSLSVNQTNNPQLLEYLGQQGKEKLDYPIVLQGSRALDFFEQVSKTQSQGEDNIIDVTYTVESEPSLSFDTTIDLNKTQGKGAATIFYENYILKSYDKIKSTIRDAYRYVCDKVSDLYNRLLNKEKQIDLKTTALERTAPFDDLKVEFIKGDKPQRLKLKRREVRTIDADFSVAVSDIDKAYALLTQKNDLTKEPIALQFKSDTHKDMKFLPVPLEQDANTKSSYDLFKKAFMQSVSKEIEKYPVQERALIEQKLENRLIEYKHQCEAYSHERELVVSEYTNEPEYYDIVIEESNEKVFDAQKSTIIDAEIVKDEEQDIVQVTEQELEQDGKEHDEISELKDGQEQDKDSLANDKGQESHDLNSNKEDKLPPLHDFSPVDIWDTAYLKASKKAESQTLSGEDSVELSEETKTQDGKEGLDKDKVVIEEQTQAKQDEGTVLSSQDKEVLQENFKESIQEANLSLLVATKAELKVVDDKKFVSFKAIDDSKTPPKVYNVKYFSTNNERLNNLQKSLTVGVPIKVSGIVYAKESASVMYAKSLEIDKERLNSIVEKQVSQDKDKDQDKGFDSAHKEPNKTQSQTMQAMREQPLMKAQDKRQNLQQMHQREDLAKFVSKSHDSRSR